VDKDKRYFRTKCDDIPESTENRHRKMLAVLASSCYSSALNRLVLDMNIYPEKWDLSDAEWSYLLLYAAEYLHGTVVKKCAERRMKDFNDRYRIKD